MQQKTLIIEASQSRNVTVALYTMIKIDIKEEKWTK